MIGAAVQVSLKQSVIARLKVREEQRRDGGHSGSEDQRVFSFFQRGHFGGNHPLVGDIEVTRVNILIRRIGISVRSAGENRAANSAGALVEVSSCVHANGGRS